MDDGGTKGNRNIAIFLEFEQVKQCLKHKKFSALTVMH